MLFWRHLLKWLVQQNRTDYKQVIFSLFLLSFQSRIVQRTVGFTLFVSISKAVASLFELNFIHNSAKPVEC